MRLISAEVFANTENDEKRIAESLQQDIDECQPSRFFTRGQRTLTLKDAYEVQRHLRTIRERRGETVVGFKIGCTSPRIRETLGISEAVCGYLWRAEQLSNACELQHTAFRRLAIEGELCIRLLSTDGPVASWMVEYHPVVELHHSIFDGTAAERACELVARNCIHAGVVHGGETLRCRLGDIPLSEPMIVRIDGNIAEQPVLGELELGGLLGPLATVSFLKGKLESKGHDERLHPGDFILTSTPGSLIPVVPGTFINVAFKQLSVECMVVPSTSKM